MPAREPARVDDRPRAAPAAPAAPAASAASAASAAPIGILANAGRGLAVGALLAIMGSAAYAGQNLRLFGPIGDALASMELIGAFIGLVLLALVVATRVIGLLLRLMSRVAPRADRLVHDPALPALRFLRHWSVASTIAIVAMVWLAPEAGPLTRRGQVL